MGEKIITICKDHQDYQVPLIWTFIFPGHEYWCPYCDHKYGMFGDYINTPETPELIKRKAAFIELSFPYLSDHHPETIKYPFYQKIERVAKTEDLPKFDYWMLNIAHQALQMEYQRHKIISGVNKACLRIFKKDGYESSVEYEKQFQDNKMTQLGKIWQTMKRIELIRESITDHVNNNQSNEESGSNGTNDGR